MMRRLGLVAVALTLVAAAPARAAGEQQLGRWTAPFWEGGDLPFDPPSREKSMKYPTAATAVVLPDGRLLYWNGLEGSENGELWVGSSDGTIKLENARVRIMDLRTGSPHWSTSVFERGLTNDPEAGRASQDLFCADQKLLYDGTLLVAGGSRWDAAEDVPDVRGIRATRVFDPADDAFTAAADMREPRWYPSLVTLPDGRVLVSSGVRRVMGTALSPEASFSQVRLAEIYDPARRRWADGGLSDRSFPLYPRLHLLPDGTVFYGGAGQSWNPAGGAADQLFWSQRRIYDPAEKRWRSAGEARYGMRSGAASIMLRLQPPYDRADILMAGGTLGATPSTFVANTLSEVVRWTSEGISSLGATKQPLAGLAGDPSQLRSRRWFGTPVMLPTGEVMLVNGGDADDVLDPGGAAPVRVPELFDPRTRTWSQLAPAARDRVYHNSAVLLPDGRVLVGGNAPHPAHYFQHQSTVARNNNFRDSTFEIYEPPYLFRGDRPGLTAATPAGKGRAIRLTLAPGTNARDISEVVLVRIGANTHSMDADLRAVRLEHQRRGARILARLPRGGDGRVLPPGPYYVFAIRNSGDGPVPSVAQVILIQPRPGGRVAASAPMS